MTATILSTVSLRHLSLSAARERRKQFWSSCEKGLALGRRKLLEYLIADNTLHRCVAYASAVAISDIIF